MILLILSKCKSPIQRPNYLSAGLAVPVIMIFYNPRILQSSDGLGCFRYHCIHTIFKMANIVTWQELGINLLDVLTKVHFVQFATFQQPEHECQILGREETSCLKLIAYSYSDMSETSPYGYIVHVDSTVRKELLTSRTLRVSPSICSA